MPCRVPFTSQEVWNPYERPPLATDVSEDLPAFFGVVFDSAGWCFARNKARNIPGDIFRSDIVFAAALQGPSSLLEARHNSHTHTHRQHMTQYCFLWLSQVFATEDFPRTIAALQSAQAVRDRP